MLNKLEIGLSSCSKTMSRELFRDYRDAGITKMEISYSREEYDLMDFNAIKAWANEFGVDLWSFHLPFWPFSEINIASENESVRSATVDYFAELISRASKIGIRIFIIHPSGEPNAEDKRDALIKNAKDSLKKLANIADEFGGIIAVEDLPRTCLGRDSSDILELVSADTRLRVCFDTNHLLKEDNLNFIKQVGKRIVTTHVSDYNFIDEQHWLPGEGNVDWNALFSALIEVGYDGPWLYELGFGNTKKITRSRDLTCKDFKRNAEEIFEGKKITVIK